MDWDRLKKSFMYTGLIIVGFLGYFGILLLITNIFVYFCGPIGAISLPVIMMLSMLVPFFYFFVLEK